jgi:hypothetical protein
MWIRGIGILAVTYAVVGSSAPFSDHPVHFCPGTQGGSEWNGAAYDPATNLIYTGAVD